MASDLLKHWNIGEPDCQNGVILLFSEADQRLFVRCKRIVHDYSIATAFNCKGTEEKRIA